MIDPIYEKEKAELEDIIRGLNSLISELSSIASGINDEFFGIGNEYCAKCIVKEITDIRQLRDYCKRFLQG